MRLVEANGPFEIHGDQDMMLALDALLSESAARLTDHPQLGRPGRVAGTRELVAHRNYLLVYDVVTDTVRVLRILHAARQWPPQKA